MLKWVVKKLSKAWSEHNTELSYGMVGLPEEKMKAREGTVVDDDDFV